MRQIILFFIISQILFSGWSSSGNKLLAYYGPEYKVTDRGKLEVIVKARACALLVDDAVLYARQTAEFHLRSVVGSQNHRKIFQEVDRYYDGDKICVEMSAAALLPL